MSSVEGITADDIPRVTALLNRVFRTTGGDMGVEYGRFVGSNNIDNIFVIKCDGVIMSTATINFRQVSLDGVVFKVAQLGGVATAEEARRQGHASMLVSRCVERAREEGAQMMFISGDKSIYLKAGARRCGRFTRVTIPREQAIVPVEPSEYSFRRATLEDVGVLARLRQTKRRRHLLPREDMEQGVHNSFAMNKPVEWWIVSTGDTDKTPIAYGAVHHNKEDDSLLLVEYAGELMAMTSAVHHWFSVWDQAKTFTYTADDAIPREWSVKKEWITYEGFHGTVMMIDAFGFWERVQDYVKEVLGERPFESTTVYRKDDDPSALVFINNGESFQDSTVCGARLVTTVFGKDPTEEDIVEKQGHDGCPYEDLPDLTILLSKKVFPLPLVWYGTAFV
eukprot:TRINITY_DN2440_c0_g1_i2.p1 TRINITY_DN2440_c0_g1~~TRINITY_DN2440_c0_g1_i2.p1  ORF type:complete len:394 (+),score=82.72 TRINITY_DN2440_c0_g1_i2:67-1248(+)